MPVAVSPRVLRRAIRRKLRALAMGDGPLAPARALDAVSYLETQALLEQLRQASRRQSRVVTGRNSARAYARFMTQAAGQRMARAMRKLSERLSAAEASLCG